MFAEVSARFTVVCVLEQRYANVALLYQIMVERDQFFKQFEEDWRDAGDLYRCVTPSHILLYGLK
jgi:hypothetical protein